METPGWIFFALYYLIVDGRIAVDQIFLDTLKRLCSRLLFTQLF